MSLHHAMRSAVNTLNADPDFKNVSLLLLGNGTNGGQNNTFTDGSSNAFSITRYGNTTQGTFSPFGYNWSNYFDGNGDYLSVSSSAISGVGSSNFSIECWVFATRQTNTYAQGLVSYGIAGSVTGTSFLSFQLSASGYLAVAYATGSSLTLTDPTLFPINQWVHAVVCRSGSTLSLFVNGTRVATATTSATVGNSGDTLFVGGQWYDTTTGRQLQGYISNARIVNGSSAYDATQSTLTVPTAPLTAITNTSLLTCQSNRFIDNSSNAFTITPYGDAKVTNFAPFATGSEYSTGTNGGSGYFDGTGDYLTIPSNTALDLGTGDFTVEAWVYLKSTASDWFVISSTGSGGLFFGYTNTTTPGWGYGRTAVAWDYRTGVTSSTDAWHHVAMTRSGTSIRFFVNGTQAGTTQTSSQSYDLGTTSTSVGSQGAAYYLNGNISSLRVLKGTAQYTANFTPSTTPLTAITNTSLLLNFTNASIIDSTGKNDIETVGDAQIDTGTKKYGTGSLKFDGNDYLVAPSDPKFAFGTGDYTVEAWIYPTSIRNGENLVYATDVTEGMSFGFNQSEVYIGARATAYDLKLSCTIATNTWSHFAATRSGNTARIFVNGSLIGSGTITRSCPQGPAGVGDYPTLSGNGITGYIDDLRVTKGVARYTANFTAPTRQLPAR